MSNGTDIFPPPDTFGPDGSIVKSPYYEYLVSKSTAAVFVTLFGASTLAHFIQAIRYRYWWLLFTAVLAGLGETAGWAGRLWSSLAPLNQSPYLLQIVITILAPTPFVAALFIILSRITQKLGTQYSRLSPIWYSRIFLTADIIALVVQGAGGGLAASANSDSGSKLGANIMLGGIVFQLVSLVIFIAVSSEYYYRYITDRPIRFNDSSRRGEWGRRMKVFTVAMMFMLGFMLIRSVYRTLELADGWNGKIITTQIYFDIFDGLMVFLAMATMNFFHPGYWMKTVDEGKLSSESLELHHAYSGDMSQSTFVNPNASTSKV